jgi:hypothetical protein
VSVVVDSLAGKVPHAVLEGGGVLPGDRPRADVDPVRDSLGTQLRRRVAATHERAHQAVPRIVTMIQLTEELQGS